jgi:anaerobic magnesium-protoporphyrin IX monomethyl ester cyclase
VENMEILLVVPKYTYNNLFTSLCYQYTPPIGLAYISAALKKAGFKVDCINLNHHNGSVETLVTQALSKKKYDFVLSGGMTIDYAILDKIFNAAKQHESNPIVIAGGQIVTTEPELMAKELKFDYGIIGEGEETIVKLINAIKKKSNLSEIDGICFKKDGKIIITKPASPPMNLDSLPFPDYEGLELDKQINHLAGFLYNFLDDARGYLMIASRGCPFQCTFCYHYDKRYRVRSVENVISEIRNAVKKFRINSFILVDDMFAGNKRRLWEFCDELDKLNKELSVKLYWSCSLPVTAVDSETLIRIKQSGANMIGLGLESYSAKVLKSMKKPITPQKIDEIIQLCMEIKIGIVGNFIFGDVAETEDTYKETLNYWKKNCHGQVQLYFIHPYPNSEIYQSCLKREIIKDKMDFLKNRVHHTNLLNMTENMSDKEWDKMISIIFETKFKHTPYVIPKKFIDKGNKMVDIIVKCPYCKKEIKYSDCFIKNKYYYTFRPICRNENCLMFFFVVSKLYKFSVKHYKKLHFLRKNYLVIRDNLLKKRV